MLPEDKISELARNLDAAATSLSETLKFADEIGLDLESAYAIQDALVALRLKRGEKRTGWKMGLTAKAKMEQMGVSTPICGVLTDKMRVSDGGIIKRSEFIHPKAEPEIVFSIGKDIPADVKEAELKSCVSGIAAGIEIIDSRFKDFKFTLKDVIADNCSSTAFVVSKTVAAGDFDCGNLGMVLEINGEPVSLGSSAAILDHPMHSLFALVRMLHKNGKKVVKGDIILAGSAAAAVVLKAGDQVSVRVQDLPGASFSVET